MKAQHIGRLIGTSALAALALAGAGCAPKPAAVAPPPVAQVVIPPRPRPPLGAPATLVIPPRDASGVRHTINFGLSPAQTVWSLRSAYNVAALDCMSAEHADILDGYKKFLKANAKRLAAVNRQVDKEFRTAAGKPQPRARDIFATQVYNYYALPPTLPAFCDAALAMSAEAATVGAKDLDAFALAAVPKLERVFLDFFDSYDQYRADLAAWRQRYAPDAAAGPAAPAPILVPPTATASPAAN